MRLLQKRSLIYRIILSLLALLSAGGMIYAQFKQLNLYPEVPSDNFLTAAYVIIGLTTAGLYWFSDNKLIKEINLVLLVVNFFLCLVSFLLNYPAELPGGFRLIMFISNVFGFVYLNLENLKGKKAVSLFILKFFNTFLAIIIGIYLLAILMTSGGSIMTQSQTKQNLFVFGIMLLVGLNLIYSCLIWFKFYRSWWSWLCSVLVTIELCYLSGAMFYGNIATVVIGAIIMGCLSLSLPYLINHHQ